MPAVKFPYTVIVIVFEFAEEQIPLVTTALMYVVAVSVPASAPVNVVELVPILVSPVVKIELLAFCH